MFNINPDEKLTNIGSIRDKGNTKAFGIKAKDRAMHMYIIGKSGMGKSTLLESMAIQDLENNEGFMFMDPHGSSVENILDYVPEHRADDILYFAPFDTECPIGFNIIEDVGYEKRHLVVSGLMSAFKKIWGADSWSSRMEHILNNTLLALLEYPNSTILDVTRMYTDKAFRKDVSSKITDRLVYEFWNVEFTGWTDRYQTEATPAIQNKMGQFISNPLVRNIMGQAKSSFDLRQMMDDRKIFIVNLSKGLIGESNASLLGSMLTTKLYLSALSRADKNKEELKNSPPFYFYVDEFQSVANDSFADIMAEARKYKLGLIIAHQYVAQMEDTVRDAVFGNVGTAISFRVGALDADTLSEMFAEKVTNSDLLNIGRGQIYIQLLIDSMSSQPFFAETAILKQKPEKSFKADVIKLSKQKFGQSKAEVEKSISERMDAFKHLEEKDRKNKNNKKKMGDKKPMNFRNNNNRPQPQMENNKKEDDSLKNILSSLKDEAKTDPKPKEETNTESVENKADGWDSVENIIDKLPDKK